MASPAIVQKITANLANDMYHLAAPGTSPVDVAWVDMQMFEHFLVGLMRTVGTGNVDTFNIIANKEADGSGTDVIIVSKTFTAGQPNADGDTVWLECTAQQIAQEGADAGIEGLRYVSAQVEMATGTDAMAVLYTRQPGRFHHEGLTADKVA